VTSSTTTVSAPSNAPTACRRDVGVVLAALFIVYFLIQPQRTFHYGPGDFGAFASAARMLIDGHLALLYSPTAQYATQLTYTGAKIAPNSLPFVYAPLSALALTPLAHLPFAAALAIYTALGMVAVTLSAWLIHRYVLPAPLQSLPTLVVVVATFSVPISWDILMANWDAFMLLALVGAAVLLPRRPVVAGILLAGLFVKPQVAFLVPVALLIARQWRPLLGLALGGGIWGVSTLVMVGTHGATQWIHIATAIGSIQASMAVGIPGLLALAGVPNATIDLIIALGTVATTSLFWTLRRQLRADPTMAIGMGILASLLLAPHVNLQDPCLLALPLCVWGRARPRQALAAALLLSLTALPYASLVGVAQEAHLELLAMGAIAIGLVWHLCHPVGRDYQPTSPPRPAVVP
jgi:hypothetical protein